MACSSTRGIASSNGHIFPTWCPALRNFPCRLQCGTVFIKPQETTLSSNKSPVLPKHLHLHWKHLSHELILHNAFILPCSQNTELIQKVSKIRVLKKHYFLNMSHLCVCDLSARLYTFRDRWQEKDRTCNVAVRNIFEPQQLTSALVVSFHGAQAIQAQSFLFPSWYGMHNKEVAKSFVRLWWKLFSTPGMCFSLSQAVMRQRFCLFTWLKRPQHLMLWIKLLSNCSLDIGFLHIRAYRF